MNTNKRKKINQALNFIEELNWFLDSKKSVLKELPQLIREEFDNDIERSITEKYSSVNQNKNSLVGILPFLFLDTDLFKSNSDIGDFSESMLRIFIPRIEKRSRFEIIGLIVCAVPALNDSELSSLVEALSNITGNKEKLRKVKAEKKKADFSWNETIQKLNEL